MAKPTDPNLKCSFCGKTQDQVKKLIAGPDVCICDECIELCNEILDEELFNFKQEEKQIEELKEVITGIRNVRTKMNVHPSKKSKLIFITEKFAKFFIIKT